MKNISEIVRDLREDSDLKQKDVADYLNMSRTTYNHYELGHTSFTSNMIIELSNFFHTTPNVLRNFKSSNEITDIKLCKFVKKENLDVDKIIHLISIAKNL